MNMECLLIVPSITNAKMLFVFKIALFHLYDNFKFISMATVDLLWVSLLKTDRLNKKNIFVIYL